MITTWREKYGYTLVDRAINLANGNVPNTVDNPIRNVPVRPAIYEFDYCKRVGGRQLRSDPDGRAYFNRRYRNSSRYVENFWRLPTRNYVFVRSQRYGEDVEATGSHNRNPDPMHLIDGDGLFRSIYKVTLSDTIDSGTWTTLGCSCEDKRRRKCKHMLAVEMVRDRGTNYYNMRNPVFRLTTTMTRLKL